MEDFAGLSESLYVNGIYFIYHRNVQGTKRKLHGKTEAFYSISLQKLSTFHIALVCKTDV